MLNKRINSAKGSWFGYGAALWALIFAALHVAWALGWYVGLDHELARQAFQRRWFLWPNRILWFSTIRAATHSRIP